MYTVNTSFMVESDQNERWLELVVERYIPFLRESGFENIVFTKVLSNDAPGVFTYSLQVVVDDISGYQRLTGETFSEYLSVAQGLFGDKVLYFTSLLKHIDC